MDRSQKVGDKVWFKGEKRPYTIKACNERYLICTKPFNLQHTVFYTIVDLDTNWRAPNDLVFNFYDYSIQADIDECLKDLITGRCGLSKRHGVEMFITNIVKKEDNNEGSNTKAGIQ
ncbi:MAG: hypothetical protein WCQ87_05790 [Parabacteroides sp.]